VSTRARNQFKGSLADVARYRSERRFKFKGRDYDYTDRLHLSVLSAYTQASVQNKDQKLVLVDAENGKRKLTLTILELQTLLDRCDRSLKRMEIARTKVDEVEA
jgi:hypothetical protein